MQHFPVTPPPCAIFPVSPSSAPATLPGHLWRTDGISSGDERARDPDDCGAVDRRAMVDVFDGITPLRGEYLPALALPVPLTSGSAPPVLPTQLRRTRALAFRTDLKLRSVRSRSCLCCPGFRTTSRRRMFIPYVNSPFD